MSLSTLNLGLSVEQITDKYIESSNYFTLRNSCINSSPIPFVTSEIKDQLSYILQVDQQESASHLTLAACKKQSQYDLDEQKRDHQESEDDSFLDTHLYFQLELIQEKIRSIETEIQQDNENIHCLQARIKNIEEDEKTHHHHSHPETVDTLSKTSHEHPHPETVEQRDDKTHTHPEDDSHLKTPHAHSRVQHMHPETKITSVMDKLKLFIL